MPYSRIIVHFALLFLQFLALKHCPTINDHQNVFSALKRWDILASQRTDNKIVETLWQKYHTKRVCLGDIRDIWLANVSDNVWMVDDP